MKYPAYFFVAGFMIMDKVAYKLNCMLDRGDRKNLMLNLVLSIFVSVNEAIGIGLIMPFVSVASDLSIIHSNYYYKVAYGYSPASTPEQFVVMLGIVFFVYYVFRGVVNLFYSYRLAKFSEMMYFKITSDIYRKYLNMDYVDFIRKGTPSLTKMLVTDSYNFTHIISAALLMVSEILLAVVLIVVMMISDYKVTMAMIAVLIVAGIVFKVFVTNKMKLLGVEREKSHKGYYKSINDTFRNYKYIKISGKSGFLGEAFREYSHNFVKTNIHAATISQIPRIVLEVIGIGVIVLLVSYMMLSSESSLTDMLPILTFFVMALFRLMPSANRIITSYNQISYYSKSLDLVYDEVNIKQEPKCNRSIVFDRDYVFENISYKYSDGSEVFKEASFSIHKKDRIGIVGASGAGKSTMVEIVMGLLYPKSGSIFVDGIELNEENVLCIRPKIGYVPQDVFLFDGTMFFLGEMRILISLKMYCAKLTC